jgi:hypothetical protein
LGDASAPLVGFAMMRGRHTAVACKPSHRQSRSSFALRNITIDARRSFDC